MDEYVSRQPQSAPHTLRWSIFTFLLSRGQPFNGEISKSKRWVLTLCYVVLCGQFTPRLVFLLHQSLLMIIKFSHLVFKTWLDLHYEHFFKLWSISEKRPFFFFSFFFICIVDVYYIYFICIVDTYYIYFICIVDVFFMFHVCKLLSTLSYSNQISDLFNPFSPASFVLSVVYSPVRLLLFQERGTSMVMIGTSDEHLSEYLSFCKHVV